jgi:hypothetical protein
VRDLVGPADEHQSELVLYRFGGGPQGGNEARKGIYAGFEAAGRILTISIPPDPIIRKNDVAHPGWKEGSYGRLLTGFVINEFEGGLEVSGEMLSEAIEFPGWSVDERGFLWGTSSLEEDG